LLTEQQRIQIEERVLPKHQESLQYWLALLRAPGIGSVKFSQLLGRAGDPESLLNAPDSRLREWGLTAKSRDYLRNPDWDSVASDLRWAEQPNNHLITLTNPLYPTQLKEIHDPPPILFITGDPEVLSTPQLAVVGSRNPSASGKENAREFSYHLASSGITITSGLAIGIDGACHNGALEAGGLTIAVTGTGLDRVYPASQHRLAHDIAESGVLVSEFPPGTEARAGNFPRRNRIISGLSLGTLVIEAAQKSGSLITARLASEQGREVFAIPGSIHNPLARGCHSLIRQGAKLVETAGDVLEELAPLIGSLNTLPETEQIDSPPSENILAPEYQKLLECMGFDPVQADLLIERSGLTPEEVSSMLILLELEGHVSSAPGGIYCRTGTNVPIASRTPPEQDGVT
jgi:DNA processing protein